MTEKKTTKTTKKSGKLTISAKSVGATANDIKAGYKKFKASGKVEVTRDPATGFTSGISDNCSLA